MQENKKIVWPDYENCIANLPNSILKKFGIEAVGKPLSIVEPYMEKDYKNIVVLLLDGMGKNILDMHLDAEGTFRSHLAGVYKSVFLSTTVAATTSAMSGLQPCEHSWLGWDCYYPQIDKNVTVFLNTIQGTEEAAADYNVAWTINPYESVVSKINKAGGKAYECAPFLAPYPSSFEAICESVKSLCKEPERKYIYAYWNEPDGLLHQNGCNSSEVKEALKNMESCVNNLVSELEDTLLIVTADHGHIDTNYVFLQDYPVLMDCLVRLPSLEPRVLNFFVKEDKKKLFEDEFKKEFGDKFLLMPMDEAIDKNLFGTGKHHKNFRSMLGNYLAISTDDLSIFVIEEKWASLHGSLTEEEMNIPLLVFDTKAECL